MKVTVIDTSLGACMAGVFNVTADAVAPLGLRYEEMTKGHQERLGGMMRDALAEAHGLDGSERIGVTVGPGSFTGLRVGLAFALGLGAAGNVPVVGISALDGLAASVAPEGVVAAVIDARRGQVYIRLFKDGVALMDAQAMALDAAVDLISTHADNHKVVMVGNGAPVLAGLDERLAALPAEPMVAPRPEALARLAADLDPIENPPSPLYLRAPDATPPTRLPGQPRQAPQ